MCVMTSTQAVSSVLQCSSGFGKKDGFPQKSKVKVSRHA